MAILKKVHRLFKLEKYWHDVGREKQVGECEELRFGMLSALGASVAPLLSSAPMLSTCSHGFFLVISSVSPWFTYSLRISSILAKFICACFADFKLSKFFYKIF